MGGTEQKYVQEAFDTNWIAPLGPNVNCFEKDKENLAGFEGISFLEEPGSDYFSNYWLTCIQVDPAKTNGVTRETLRLAMEAENIESRPLWKPMHLQPVFKDCPFYGEGISDALFEKGLCLPSGSNLTDEDKNRVLKTILKALRQ